MDFSIQQRPYYYSEHEANVSIVKHIDLSTYVSTNIMQNENYVLFFKYVKK